MRGKDGRTPRKRKPRECHLSHGSDLKSGVVRRVGLKGDIRMLR